jgi:hypothetical protein
MFPAVSLSYQCMLLVRSAHNQASKWYRALIDNLLVVQLVDKFPAFYDIKKFITLF